jgi:TolB-like protein/Tfp pilus assembly protein PilF/DNA-binding winged helix-turn-helix (wHTH) protein
VSADLVPIGDGLTLHLARGCLLRDEEPVHLRPQSYEVLKFLVEQRGRLITKDELIGRVWGGRAVGDGSLGKCIEEVREALGPARQRLRTVWGRGYILEPAGMEPPAPADLPESSRAASIATRPPAVRAAHWSSRGRYVIAAGSLLVVAAFALWRYVGASVEPVTSVAVLPFVNASGAADLEHLSDGISETVIDRLSRISQLRVIASSSSFKYRSTDTDPRVVSTALDVSAIVTGRVAIRGDRVHVTAELVDGRSRARLWGDQYSRGLSDLPSIQTEISLDIAEQLHVRLTAGERQWLARSGRVNPQAHELVLKGRYFWNKRTRDAFERAIEYFKQAIAVDPGYALAHAGLADAYASLADYSPIPRKEDFSRAKSAALQALAIDETLVEAHTSLAWLLWAEGDLTGAERGFKRAIDLNPGYATAHHWYGNYLRQQKRPDEAIAELRRALEIDPLSMIINTALGGHYSLAGEYDKAIAQLQATIDLDPTFANAHEFLGDTYLQAGRPDDAVSALEKAVELSARGEVHLGKLGHAYAVSGRTAEARSILAELLELRQRSAISATNIALVYAGLGDRDSAFAWFESALREQDTRLSMLRDRRLAGLRSDPRFASLVERGGLQR